MDDRPGRVREYLTNKMRDVRGEELTADEAYALYEHAKSEFREAYGTEDPLPDLEVVDGGVYPDPSEVTETRLRSPERLALERPGKEPVEYKTDSAVPYRHKLLVPSSLRDSIDRSEYTIRIGKDDLKQYGRNKLQKTFLASLKMNADMALEELYQDHQDDIARHYETLDPAFDIDHVIFSSRTMSKGQYSYSSNTVRIDDSAIKYIDLENGTPKEGEKHELVHAVVHHETVHGLQYGMDDAYQALSERTFDLPVGNENSDAFIEAATTFEHRRRHPVDDDAVPDELATAAEAGPDSLRNYAETHKDEILGDEYTLGFLSASAVYSAFKDDYDEEKALDLTREWLMTCATTAHGMEGTVAQAFEMMDMDPPAYLAQDRRNKLEKWLSQLKR